MVGETKFWRWAAWLPLLAALVVAAAPQAQTPKSRQTGRQVFNYPPPHQLQKKMIIQWGEDRPLPTGGNVLFRDLRVDTFLETGEAGLTMEAPECVFNANEFSGASPGSLKVRTADTNSFIEGTGYLWSFKGSNLTVTISNSVATTLKRDFLNSGTNILKSSAVGTSATNLYVYIRADRVFMDRGSNVAIYTGHVHAWDERLDLTCETLSIRGATNTVTGTNATVTDKISEIVADENVVILDKAGAGRATGDRAIYGAVDGEEVVTLTGNPHWQDGPREATAQAFIFEHVSNTLRAVGGAHFRLPAGSVGKTGFIMLPQPGAAPAASTTANVSTNLTDFYAGTITLQLPATNGGPLLGVIAETNVLVKDAANESEASGWRAVYTQTNGTVELSGKASARAGQRLARGELLTFNQNDNTFAARTNAYLQFPPGELKESAAYGNLLSTNAGTTTNQLVRFSSDSYEFLNQTLTFHGGVHGEYLMDDTVRATLDGGSLEVGFINTNLVREIVAAGGVHLRQLPALDSKGKLVESDFKGEWVQILVRTNELETRTNFLLEQVKAAGSVAGQRTTIATNLANAAHPVTTNRMTFSADRVTATFMPDTNQVSVVVGEGKVTGAQDDYTAQGEKVVYTATNDTVVLTGDPKLFRPAMGWSSAEQMIIFNHATDGTQWIGRMHTMVLLPASTLARTTQQAEKQPRHK